MAILKIYDPVTDAWIEIPGGVSDHGSLTGLSDDDHTIYLKTDGSRDLTGNQSAGSNKLTNLAAGTVAADAVRKDQVVLVDGSQAWAGNQSLGTNKLTNLKAGTSAADAVRLDQVHLQSDFVDTDTDSPLAGFPVKLNVSDELDETLHPTIYKTSALIGTSTAVLHQFGKYPQVSVYNTATGVVVEALVTHSSTSSVTVEANSSLTGYTVLLTIGYA